MRKHTLLIILICFIGTLFSAQAAILPTDFVEAQFVGGLNRPTTMQFAPDGRLFVAEQDGTLRVVLQDGTLLPTPFLTVTVNSVGERGLLGITFDPNFATNNFLYVYYTATTPNIHNRVSRFTANGNVVLPGSEVILLELDPLSGATNHNGGTLNFGPDGLLYIAAGDNANGANAQTLNNLLGKILRINPDGSIPASNPFVGVAVGNNQAIWALGLRNPFVFSFQPGTGIMFINDVGQNTWEEINLGVIGSNYGWPTTEGETNNPAFRSPLYVYDHTTTNPFGCAITGGAFYNPATLQFPADYVGDYFFMDYCENWIWRYDPATDTAVAFAIDTIPNPVDMKIGTDGSVYYMARGTGINTGIVQRIAYSPGALPTITQDPADALVAPGQPTSFTCSATGAVPLTYQWQRNGVDIPAANAATLNLSTTALADNGTRFRCVASNLFGNDTSAEAILTVTNNTPPLGVIDVPPVGTQYSAGEVITFSGTGTDAEDGVLPASAFTWEVVFHHDVHTHPFLAPAAIGAVQNGTFTIPTLGHVEPTVFYRIRLRVTDSGGLTHDSFRDILPHTSSITLQTNVTGLQLTLDGQPVAAGTPILGVAGVVRALGVVSPQTVNGVTYEFVSWSDGGAAVHDISTPATNTTYTATFALAGSGTIPNAGTPNTAGSGNPSILIFDPAISKIGIPSPGGFGLVGEAITWEITVVNNGGVAGNNIVVSDTLSSELRVDNAETSKGTTSISGQTVTFSIPTLAPGERVQMRIFTTVLRSAVDGTVINRASLTGTDAAGTQVSRQVEAGINVISALPTTGFHQHPNLLLRTGSAVMFALSVLMGVRLWRRKRK